MITSQICTVCNQEFPSKNKLFKHIRSSHQISTDINTEESIETVVNIEDQILTVHDEELFRVLVKPQGLATMGQKGVTLMSSDRTMLPDAMKLKLCYKKAVPCHRLDKGTGGLVLCSKTKDSEVLLRKLFREKLVVKKYLAIVAGKLEPEIGKITRSINGQPTVTIYRVIKYTNSKQYRGLTTVELFPITGKKHQLRRHMQFVGHSIIGDRKYSRASSWPSDSFKEMFLWSIGVCFPNPKHRDRIEEVIAMRRNEESSKLSTDDKSKLRNDEECDDCNFVEDSQLNEEHIDSIRTSFNDAKMNEDDGDVPTEEHQSKRIKISELMESSSTEIVRYDVGKIVVPIEEVDPQNLYISLWDGSFYGLDKLFYGKLTNMWAIFNINEPEYYEKFRILHESI